MPSPETWTCLGCDRDWPILDGQPTQQGYHHLCLACSVERAEKMLDIDGPREVAWDTDLLRWYIAHLKRQIETRENELRHAQWQLSRRP
jgi:hypothetical protein